MILKRELKLNYLSDMSLKHIEIDIYKNEIRLTDSYNNDYRIGFDNSCYPAIVEVHGKIMDMIGVKILVVFDHVEYFRDIKMTFVSFLTTRGFYTIRFRSIIESDPIKFERINNANN
jgi:hypothetical protein